MSADLILYGLIAAGLVFWLKNILGTRSDDDLERPSKFLNLDGDDNQSNGANKDMGSNKNDLKSNIVNLESLSGVAFILPRNVRIDNKTTENRLTDLSKKYPDFDLTHFSQNLENAFTMIIEAFADGDLETLEALLLPSVYEAFKSEIEARQERGEIVETDVQAVEKIDIIEASLQGDDLSITTRFTAREICVIRDDNGDIISGDPKKITQMVDVWVFTKDISEKGPEWFLQETRDDEIEDHKTPLPDAKDTPKAKSKKATSSKTTSKKTDTKH